MFAKLLGAAYRGPCAREEMGKWGNLGNLKFGGARREKQGAEGNGGNWVQGYAKQGVFPFCFVLLCSVFLYCVLLFAKQYPT